eukprot:10466636-Alexandrium_andersonii.AAC.1
MGVLVGCISHAMCCRRASVMAYPTAPTLTEPLVQQPYIGNSSSSCNKFEQSGDPVPETKDDPQARR